MEWIYEDFLKLDWFMGQSEVSPVIIQSTILSAIVCIGAAIACFQYTLKKKAPAPFWLGVFSVAYGAWNILYLVSYTQRDFETAQWTLTAAAAHRSHLMVALFLPLIASKFVSVLFFERAVIARLTLMTCLALLAVYFFPLEEHYAFANLLVGLFVFVSFGFMLLKLVRVYRTTDDLKLKTRSFFVLIGSIVCSFFAVIGQLRADGAIRILPLPYLGNILTAVFIYFLYLMVANPRLREVRELMLRGIRIFLMSVILSVIFISLLAWVGREDYELFVFNTFLASFIIISVLEPLRDQIDTFFLKQFIVDRYEFEQLLKRLPRKIRASRLLSELAQVLINDVRESGRIYQAGLYLWDDAAGSFRLIEPSNLNFRTSLQLTHPLLLHLKKSPHPLLLEHDQDLPPEVREELKEMHSHMALPLLKQDELLGIWTLRTSLRSTNPYSSFSDTEIQRLESMTQDIVSVLDQIHHFDNQERQKRLAALGEMSAALAHEIRNPLGAIHGAVQLLQTSPTLMNSEDRECVDILQKETDRMSATVNQYLNFARSNEDPIEVNLDTLILKMLENVRPKAQKTATKLHRDVANDLPNVSTDPLKLEQVLFNLVQNACEAFSRNIWVKAYRAPQDGIQIEIQDDGPGMPAAVLTNIFIPLFTTKKAGSGLGLPICKKMIDSLGGRISVESKLNEGTRFLIFLPLRSEKDGRLVRS